jgi:hypothetical protein
VDSQRCELAGRHKDLLRVEGGLDGNGELLVGRREVVRAGFEADEIRKFAE